MSLMISIFLNLIYIIIFATILYLVSKIREDELALSKSLVYSIIFILSTLLAKYFIFKITKNTLALDIIWISFWLISMYSFWKLEANESLTIKNIIITISIFLVWSFIIQNLWWITIL